MSARWNSMGCSISTKHPEPRWRGWDEDLSVAWDRRFSPNWVLNQKGKNRNRQRRRRRRRRLNMTW